MTTTSKQLVAAHALLLLACAGGAAPEPRAEPAATPEVQTPRAPASASAQASLTRISDPSTVCMVNDQHMGVAQIPVAVEGKTYFGCCQMCEARLKSDGSLRLATDPVTQKRVDKATAVLAMDVKGKVLYFESERSMQAYAARL